MWLRYFEKSEYGKIGAGTWRNACKVIGIEAAFAALQRSKRARVTTSRDGYLLKILACAAADPEEAKELRDEGAKALRAMRATEEKRAAQLLDPMERAKALYDAWTDDMREKFCASLNGHLKPAPRAAFERRAFTDASLRRACVEAIIEKGLV